LSTLNIGLLGTRFQEKLHICYLFFMYVNCLHMFPCDCYTSSLNAERRALENKVLGKMFVSEGDHNSCKLRSLYNWNVVTYVYLLKQGYYCELDISRERKHNVLVKIFLEKLPLYRPSRRSQDNIQMDTNVC
jgi:hypothetical protein